jgi:SAM-dependent methyltransferase
MKYYNDPTFSYPAFWEGREYEHQAELLAIQKLLGDRKFDTIADIGAGYGRLVDVLSKYSQKIILIDPSHVQLDLVRDFSSTAVETFEGSSEHTGLEDESCDLVTMVRVAHHILNLKPSFREVGRIVKPKGLFLLEFANSTNFKARARSGFGPMLLSATDIGRKDIKVPFVNHHPTSIKRMLREEGFVVIGELSVSNFRSPLAKKVLPTRLLVRLEEFLQPSFSKIYFGPSVFILVQKSK